MWWVFRKYEFILNIFSLHPLSYLIYFISKYAVVWCVFELNRNWCKRVYNDFCYLFKCDSGNDLKPKYLSWNITLIWVHRLEKRVPSNLRSFFWYRIVLFPAVTRFCEGGSVGLGYNFRKKKKIFVSPLHQNEIVALYSNMGGGHWAFAWPLIWPVRLWREPLLRTVNAELLSCRIFSNVQYICLHNLE